MLTGKKTRIRPLEEEDIERLLEWAADEEVNYWSSGAWPLNTLQTREQIMEKFLDSHPDVYRYGIETNDGLLIGTIGFDQINVPARSVSLMIVIGDKAYWGQGYGTDAIITFARFLFAQWNFHRISLDTWDENKRALKAYEKAGFKLEGCQRAARFVLGNYRDALLMGLLREEFFTLHGK